MVEIAGTTTIVRTFAQSVPESDMLLWGAWADPRWSHRDHALWGSSDAPHKHSLKHRTKNTTVRAAIAARGGVFFKTLERNRYALTSEYRTPALLAEPGRNAPTNAYERAHDAIPL